MQNILEILKGIGIEVPKDKTDTLNEEVAKNYKTIGEHDKKVKKLETERDGYKEQLDTANETLKGFEGVDVEEMNKKLEQYKTEKKEMEEKHKQEIYKRDFADALSKAMEEVKFTSESARDSVMRKITDADLKLIDGKIIGLNDMIATIKEKDASAFVDEEQQNLENNKPHFTRGAQGNKEKKGHVTMTELFKMKNENPDLDISQYIGKDE